jgi:hypothetical protein
VLNTQITDAVTQTAALTTGQAAAVSMGLTYLVMAQTIGMVMANAVTAQRGMQRIAEASVVVTTAAIISKGLAAKPSGA